MIKILELFSGIGAASKALTNLGIEHEIVDAVEIDKYAIKSFNAIHGTNFEPQDITKWDKDLEVDLIMHGSPCQDFSVAGRQAGGDEGSGTRSSLMYETIRIVDKLRPKYVVWENVKNLLSKKHRHNFDAYLEKMESLGYHNYYKVLNAKDFGIPQNRNRVFTVSIRADKTFEFPEPTPLKKTISDILESEVDEKYYLTEEQMKNLNFANIIAKDKAAKAGRANRLGGLYDNTGRHQAGSIFSVKGITGTLDTMSGGNREPIILEDFTRSTRSGLKVLQGRRIRKLTARECWRLMKFSDEDFDKAKKAGVSSSQLYKQAGNSICVSVLEAVFNSLL